ncbi:hypothetical protein [Aestuariivirga sp.]|uniref:hypothetical protein n=1 Tax=Aestuariivirga sp. TaxID=2650926 RepID=UPI003593A46E
MKSRINKRTTWREHLDQQHEARKAAAEKKKTEKFEALKSAINFRTIEIEHQKQEKIMTVATQIKMPKNAAEQKALVDRQANNILKAKAVRAKFDAKVKSLTDAREQMLASMSPSLRKKYEADVDAKNDFQSKIADIRADMHEEVAALRAEVSQINAAIKETKDYLGNPISVGNAYMIGSQRRDSIARSLDGAGPKKIADLYRTALLTEDLELGSEVIAALERTDKKYRPFPVMAAAEALFGSMVAGVKDNASLADVQYATIHETMAEVEGVRPMTTLEKMSFSLHNPGVGRINPPDAEDSNSGVTATNKISAGLAARQSA